jgi:hypothetical protein
VRPARAVHRRGRVGQAVQAVVGHVAVAAGAASRSPLASDG